MDLYISGRLLFGRLIVGVPFVRRVIYSGVGNHYRAYSEQFVFAPARRRSFTIGASWEIK